MILRHPGELIRLSAPCHTRTPARGPATATAGLLGAIDEAATGDGVIVCTDGFRAGTVSPEAFLSLVSGLGLAATVTEVDASSLFCDIRVR